jgi:GT2 family glycosyltransferase
MRNKVIIITLNYNQNDYTLKCINSLLKSNYINYNIILIDNGSTEKNFNLLKRKLKKDPKILLIRLEKNRGYVGGINYGFKEAIKINPKYLLIMNNDTIIDKYAISELVKTIHKYKNKAIVSGKVYNYEETKKLQLIGLKMNNKNMLEYTRIGIDEIDIGQYEDIIEMDNLDDVFWLFPKELYLEISGYNKYFWFNAEQADFALRAKKVGYKLIYTPEAKIWHKGSVSIGGSDRNPKLAYWNVQSYLIFKYLHLSKKYFIIIYLMVIKSIITIFLKSVLEKIKNNKKSFKYAKAKLYGLLYFNKWMIKRNENNGYNPFK